MLSLVLELTRLRAKEAEQRLAEARRALLRMRWECRATEAWVPGLSLVLELAYLWEKKVEHRGLWRPKGCCRGQGNAAGLLRFGALGCP